jgi:predicted TIM-barrel fold metal-dependent hydrolase
MIVDAQIHAWRETVQYPTPDAVRPRHGSEYPIERALEEMDRHGVDRAILVPPASWPTGPTRNSYSLDAAARFPDRFGVMGLFDFDGPKDSARLAGWRANGMLGIRAWLADPQASPSLTDRAFDWFWSGLQEHAIPFMSAAPGRMRLYADLLERFPGLRLIIDHCGRDPLGLRGPAAWSDLDQTLTLARWPQTTIKVSCLPANAEQPYPFADLHGPIRRIFDAFGPRRMLWGSDATRLPCSYGENLALFQEALPFLANEDRTWILGRTALKACDWNR